MTPQSMSRSPSLAIDVKALGALKLEANRKDPAAIAHAAKEFESLFMRELIKSMRQATMRSGLLDSQAGDMGADLLDQQLAQVMSGRPGGLSEIIARQLSKQVQGADKPLAAYTPTQNLGVKTVAPKAADFVSQHQQAAIKVSQASGIPAPFMLGQAGLESGWGQHEIRHKDGSSSFNLFGIKAGADWKGKVAEVMTTEYIQNQAVKVVARFRAYDSYADSFKDYAKLITGSARYAKAAENMHSAQSYAANLQQAGYATDPQYAQKLSRAIAMSMRAQDTKGNAT
jgi:flagellar protein FlgJ